MDGAEVCRRAADQIIATIRAEGCNCTPDVVILVDELPSGLTITGQVTHEPCCYRRAVLAAGTN